MRVKIVVEYGYTTTVFLGNAPEGYELEKANFYVGDTFNVVGEATVYGIEHWICDSSGNPQHEPFFLPKNICELA